MWDKPLNRAMNKVLKKDPLKPPAGGRLHGIGTGAHRKCYYSDGPLEMRERRKANNQAKRDDKILKLAQQAAQEQVNRMIPSIIEACKAWHHAGGKGEVNFIPPPIVGSTSMPLSREDSPVIATHHSSPSVSNYASPIDDLNVLKVSVGSSTNSFVHAYNGFFN
jgi:hypothetical protein